VSVVPDFRADPSDSPEGKGIARRAWDAYVEALRPVSDPVAKMVGRKVSEDLVGFWVLWHLCGGFEGLQRYGMHKSTIWRKVAKFRTVTGKHPDEFTFTGITIDRGAAWGALIEDDPEADVVSEDGDALSHHDGVVQPAPTATDSSVNPGTTQSRPKA
jgi:hypothetical protein